MGYVQLHRCQELQEVSSVHVVQVKQQVFAIPWQLYLSQLWEGTGRYGHSSAITWSVTWSGYATASSQTLHQRAVKGQV